MGMAASQARYLALTARKTNTEWEGQQINQARTALANQSANLFNQLLSMEVPNPPKETDYSEVKYSYTDGDNKSVIEKWDKIGNDNGDYNYVVQHYYMAEIFAGAKKQLTDPQIQLGDVLKTLDYDPATTTVQKDASGTGITVTYKINDYPYEQQYGQKITQDMIDSDEKLKSAVTSFETAIGFAKADGTLNTDAVYGYQDSDGTWHFFVANDYNKITESQAEADEALKEALTKFETENGMISKTVPLDYDNVYGTKDSNGVWHFLIKSEDTEITESKADADEELKDALRKYEIEAGIIDESEPLVYDNIYGVKENGLWYFLQANDDSKITEEKTKSDAILKSALTSYELSEGMTKEVDVLSYDGVYGYKGSDGTWHFTVDKQQTADSFMRAYDNKDYSTVSNEPAYVGNSRLTELNKLIVDESKGIDQVTELAQILRDCPTDSINQYVSFDSQGKLVYEGKGIYTFELNGKTYYTTRDDLFKSINSSTTAPNEIDSQGKLTYYNTATISKKIEETNNALLETDSSGRFTSVKFDNDSLVYNLNIEKVTNTTAYEDAMNQYLYKKAQYEKTIADINAKTSIIQKEDRTLELRLKQLDTEQNALATEMDAVKKVIKDNVEKTFKTFSD